MRFLDTRFAALITLTLLSGTSSGAGPAEQRCTEIGATCVCSEPLDFSSSDIDNGHDPSDSEGGGAKECNGSGAIFQTSSGNQSTVSAASVGLTGPTQVLRVRMQDNLSLLDSARTFTDKTWCTRHYFRYSSDFPNLTNSLDRAKGPYVLDSSGGNHPGMETEWQPGTTNSELMVEAEFGGSSFGQYSDYGQGPTLPRTGDRITLSDCRTGWCRFEICFDHNHTGADKLNWRARLVKISNGNRDDWEEISPSSASTATTGSSPGPQIVKTYTEGPYSGSVGGKYQYYSHVMVAIKSPADPNFWIGPAHEITSDVDNGGGQPTPPAAPVLLP